MTIVGSPRTRLIIATHGPHLPTMSNMVIHSILHSLFLMHTIHTSSFVSACNLVFNDRVAVEMCFTMHRVGSTA